MRISGLSAATGVPVATIKYYLREGLLHQGERTGATQALYDESHVARLRLIRALLTVGGLSVAAVRDVLQSLEHEDVLEALATAQEGLSPKLADSLDLNEAQQAMAILGWRVGMESAAMRQLAVALQAVGDGGLPLSSESLRRYADAAHRIAEHEIANMPGDGAEALTYAVVGTVLYEPVLLALRRLAHQDVSERMLGST
ncbi:MAG TPA: MerR family transcriptional regulator [Actinomycetales bacterium]|nr:MerR family transcriptional regulator [Actinomycetales bacterium]